MKPTSLRLPKSYTYGAITQHCSDQISSFVADAQRHTGLESRYRRERAYGVYMGWRALVAEHTPAELFRADDQKLESLLMIDLGTEADPG